MSELFDPASVAVVGASDDPAKWGYWLAKGALSGAARRPVYLVNGRSSKVQGHPAWPSLRALPRAPELVAIVTPPETYESVVEDALAAGARRLVAITAGVDRAYPGGHAALAERVRAAGARLLGPTCMGVFDGASDLALTWGTLTSGPIGVVSQSGSVGLEIGYLAARAGLGLSRFVSVGAAADLDAAELLDDVLAAPHTRVVVVYLEDLSIGRSLLDLADRATALGKRMILLAVGGSSSGGRAVASHTGALATPDKVVDALCAATGAIRVRTPAEAVHAAQACIALPGKVAGRPLRLAVVADSGGQGAVAAELAERGGLEVPEFGAATVSALAGLLPEEAGLTNPVDLAGGGEADLMVYPRTAKLVASQVDAVLLSGYFGSYAADSPALAQVEEAAARRLLDAVAETGTACLVHAMRTDGPAGDVLRAGGVAVFSTADEAVSALTAVARACDDLRPEPSVNTPDAARTGKDDPDTRGVAGTTAWSFAQARDLLVRHGLSFPDGGPVRTPAEAGDRAARLGGRVVLKAMGPAHKTEVGGVVLDLIGAGDTEVAARDMANRLSGAGVPLEGFWVERQTDSRDAVELLVGARRDPNLGVIVTVGAGGVLAELVGDSVSALGPVDPETARRLIARTRVARLLSGWRGSPPLDAGAAALAVSAVGHALAGRPELAELEVNPLMVTPAGAIALDALAVPEQAPEPAVVQSAVKIEEKPCS